LDETTPGSKRNVDVRALMKGSRHGFGGRFKVGKAHEIGLVPVEKFTGIVLFPELPFLVFRRKDGRFVF
jgi:hypothetical protein